MDEEISYLASQLPSLFASRIIEFSVNGISRKSPTLIAIAPPTLRTIKAIATDVVPNAKKANSLVVNDESTLPMGTISFENPQNTDARMYEK